MNARTNQVARANGQIVVVFALSLIVVILAVALVIDGGNAWSQRRTTQNAADFAALAGTRVVSANAGVVQANAAVRSSVELTLASNGLATTVLGTDYAASYVGTSGNLVAGYGTAGTIPAGVIGVQVTPTKTFRTYFLGVVGMTSFNASATATAKYGFYEGTFGGPGGNLVPVAVTLATITSKPQCPVGAAAGSATPGCTPVPMTDDGLENAAGQFRWMSWDGTADAVYTCGTAGTGGILGPPANSPSLTVPANGSIRVPGNTGVSNVCKTNIDNWIALGTTVLVPIISPGPPPAGQTCITMPQNCYVGTTTPYPPTSVGGGAATQYNVIGFAGFQLTGCGNPCIKNLEGVFRQTFLLGPTGGTTGTPSTPGGTLGIQLVR